MSPRTKMWFVVCGLWFALAIHGGELRTVENYVPYEEFLKVAGSNPDATIMSLEEYRTLVALAARGNANDSAAMPPVKSVLSEAVYTAQAGETSIRIDAAFKVVVTGKEWVRCELGRIQNVGRITLDGAPAWVVADNGNAYLLLKGEGLHAGTLSFSLPLQREEDVQKVSANFLNAASAVMNLSVSGRATLMGDALPADSKFDETHGITRFSIALGQAGGAPVSLSWKRKYDTQKSPPLLMAEQGVAYLLERASPMFRWQARVVIARRKAEELIFIEPPGAKIVRLNGPNVHSWHRDGSNLRVLLDKPIMGEVNLQGEGILVAPPGDFELACPQLKDARQDTRYLALLEAGAGRTAVSQANALRELAVNEAPAFAGMMQIPGSRPARLFLLENLQSKAVVQLKTDPALFDTQSVMSMVIDEKQVTLRAAVSIHPEQGRVYVLRLNVPAPWKLAGLRERGTERGIGAEMSRDGESEIWNITLSSASDAAHPTDLEAIFRLNDPTWSESEWTTRNLKVALPAIAATRRSAAHLAISVHPSINVTFGEMPAWRTEEPGKLEKLGVRELSLRMGLVSEIGGGDVLLNLDRKKARGEYELVTHVLTLEREVWVRSDIRLAVVDRAVDELTIDLPPEAKDPLYIKAVDVKEIAPGEPAAANAPAQNQRRVRFNQPWQGVRMLRIEYRAPLAADADAAVPDIRLAGNFDSRRRIVFQSAGVVEQTVKPDGGLLAASLEDTPEFARPFAGGRALSAFTFGSGAAGTYRAKVLERSPALSSLARELNLTTTLDASGESRTHADFLLSYARQQYMALKLPTDATLIALFVDGESVRPVKGSAADVLSVPLPPRSFARVEMVYRRGAGALGKFGSWEEFAPDLIDIPVGVTNWKIHYPPEYRLAISDGNIESEPRSESEFFASSFWSRIASGSWPRWTAWEKHSRPNIVELDFGNSTRSEAQAAGPASSQLVAEETKRAANALQEQSAGVLAVPEGALLGASKVGGAAHLTLSYRELDWNRFASRAVFIASALLALVLALRVSQRAALRFIVAGLVLGSLVPPALNWQSPLLMIPFCEGLSLAALGALAVFAKRAMQRRTFFYKPARAAVTASILIALACAAAFGSEPDAVLIPYKKEDVKSPDADPKQTKVYVPKSVFLELMARAHPEMQPARTDAPDMDDRNNVALASAGAVASGGTFFERLNDGKPGSGVFQNGQPDGFAWQQWKGAPTPFMINLPKAQMIDRVRIQLLDQPGRYSQYKLELSEDGTRFTTLIDRTVGRYSGWQTESFSKREVRALRLTGTFDSGSDGRFHVGEIEMLSPPTIIPVALGNAAYEISLAEKSFIAKGTIELSTFDAKGWAKVPLDPGATRLTALSIDGQPASVSHAQGVPFIQISGAGKHSIGVELQGPLTLSPGRARLEAQFVCGAATRVSVKLPKDVELETKSLPAGAWVEKSADGTQRCEIDLGSGNGALALAWQSADIRAKSSSQISARSYSQFQLGPDGYNIVRAERVTIEGSPIDQLTYKVIGNWEISMAGAPDLAEWNVSGEGENKILRLWFQKPVSSVLVQIAGWAPLNTDSVQAAALSLENSLRQEGFIGLQHGGGRHFSATSLDGLKRAASQDLSAMFALPQESLPDRIYRFHEVPAKNVLAAELDPAQVSIETQIVGVIETERMLASVRSRYNASGRTPLRHEVDLPAGWTVRTVRCNAMRSWEIVEDGAKRRLVIHFTSRAAAGTELLWSAEVPLKLGAQALALDLPQPRAVADAKTIESIDWVLAADASLLLSQGAATTMTPLPIERAPRWVKLDERQDYRFAFRSAKPDSKLAIEISRQDSIGEATIVTFLRPAEDHIQINARCRLRIERAGRDRFTFKLPAGASLVSLDAKNLRSHEIAEKPDGLHLAVLLQSPVSGEQTIDLAYRLPRQTAQDVTVDSLVIEDAEIRQTEHFVGVMQAERGMVALNIRRGIGKQLDPEELPFVPEKVSKTALAYAFAAESDWSIALRQPDVKVETGIAAEVSLVVLKTVIAADGGVRTMATYTVRNRSLQFMKIEMPANASLWGVLVDGQPVTVSRTQNGTANVLWIPIQRMALTDLSIKVVLVYESPRIALPAAYQTVTPQAPKVLDMPVVQTYWQLYVPDDYEATRSGGNVKDVAASVLVAGELNSNIAESERLMKVVDSADSSYKKRKALRSLARNQQELSDNAAVLNRYGQSVDESEAKRIGKDELSIQFAGNNSVQQQANAWQARLGERSKELEEALSGGADAEQQQAFLDNFNFLGNGWRGGEKFKIKAETPAAMPGEIALSDLKNIQRFAGFQPGELPSPPAARVTKQDEPLPLEGGLRDSSDGQLALDKGAMELRIAEKGTRLTFGRVEGHPELSVILRSTSSSWRYSSLMALIVVFAGFGFMRRRAAKKATA